MLTPSNSSLIIKITKDLKITLMEILSNMKDLNNNPQDRSKITLEIFRCKDRINLSQSDRQLIVPITYKRNICLIATITTI